MDGMAVSKLQIDVAKNMGKAGDVASFLDSTPRKGLNSHLLRNLWAVAHAGQHVVFRCLARMSEEMSRPTAEEVLPLFDTPEDHAMTVRQIEEFIDAFKSTILRGYEHDDTGRGDFQETEAEPETEPNTGGLAGTIKAAIAEHGEAGLSWAEVGALFEGESHETFGAGIVEALLWAMIHAGELSEGAGDQLIASDAALSLDVLPMLEAQNQLGTEEGLPDGEEMKAIPLVNEGDEPDLASVVSVRVFAGDGATEAELVESFEDAAGVSAALAWLIETGKIESVTLGEGDEAEVRFMPFGQDLDNLHGDTLRVVYERETGNTAGRKGEKRLREEIAKARELRKAKAESEEHGDEEGPGDEPVGDDDVEELSED